MATSAELKQNILNGGYDQAFAKLYGADTATVAAQRVRYVDMIDHFEENFGTGRTVCLYSAPGRTEIGGNHTDHNNGVVIAAAVNLDIIAVVAKNDENVVRVISHGFGKIDDVNLRDLTPQPVEAEHSASLIRGVAAGIVKDGGKVGAALTATPPLTFWAVPVCPARLPLRCAWVLSSAASTTIMT
mgnify:CR=1 FL=1